MYKNCSWNQTQSYKWSAKINIASFHRYFTYYVFNLYNEIENADMSSGIDIN